MRPGGGRGSRWQSTGERGARRRGGRGDGAGWSSAGEGPRGEAGWPEGPRDQAGWPQDPRGGEQRGRGRRGRPAAEEPRDEAERAREICLNQLAVRPRTRAELATALARRGISPEVAVEVLERYDEVGMIDDAAFARAWVSSRHHGRGLARRALANELRQRGVDAETAGAALDDLDPDTEATTARALVDRKLRTARGEPEAVFRRLVGMLARKGYGPGLAIRVVKDAMAAQSAEAAEFADGVDADALADLEGGDRTE
ncbi:regulatory protein RecX [Phytohabitans maris]|uniref:regulatory protein RecX n=1 Tax=Phytohabitans maris TaxID=3071409 RepID=UPI003D162AF4